MQILKPHLWVWWTAADGNAAWAAKYLLQLLCSCLSCLKALSAASKQEPASVSCKDWPAAFLPTSVNCAKLVQRYLRRVTESVSQSWFFYLSFCCSCHQQGIKISISPWGSAVVGEGKSPGKCCMAPDPAVRLSDRPPAFPNISGMDSSTLCMCSCMSWYVSD